MKTGQPDYYIPSGQTVSQDVKNVFIRVCKQMAKLLQVSMDFFCKCIVWTKYLPERNLMGHPALGLMCGCHPTTKHSLLLPPTSRATASRYVSCWTWSRLHNHILGSILQLHLKKSSKILGYLKRLVSNIIF